MPRRALLYAPAVPKRLNLFQHQFHRRILVVWRVVVFAQNAFDHQPQPGLRTFLGRPIDIQVLAQVFGQ